MEDHNFQIYASGNEVDISIDLGKMPEFYWPTIYSQIEFRENIIHASFYIARGQTCSDSIVEGNQTILTI